MQANKPTYFDHIDGLRGVAVLLVLLFHFKVERFQGGFIGVDVFFVISGFLITRNIFLNIQKGKFSYTDFLIRRAKRLLPALLLVCIPLGIYSVLFLAPKELLLFSKSLESVFTFSSNILFQNTLSDYFAMDSKRNYLLHSWTLSLEWQFYFIYPLLCLGINKFKNQLKPLFFTILTLAAAVYSIYLIDISGHTAYFSSPPRFFEFLIGGLIALIPYNKTSFTPRLSFLISSSALASIVLLGAKFDGLTPFPGKYALFVCLLSSVVILVGNTNFILTNSFLKLTGRWSYSMYLWHWPLIVGASYFGVTVSKLVLLILFLTTYALAFLSYHLVENPFRRLKLTNKIIFSTYWVIPLVIVLIFNAWVKDNHGLPERFPFLKKINTQQKLIADLYAKNCLKENNDSETLCSGLGLSSSPKKLLLIGDSHAQNLIGFLDVLASDAGYSMDAVTKLACPTFGVFTMPHHFPSCTTFSKAVEKKIDNSRYEIVILGSHWNGYESGDFVNDKNVKIGKGKDFIKEELMSWIKRMHKKKVKIIILKSFARFNKDPEGVFFLENLPFSLRSTAEMKINKSTPYINSLFDHVEKAEGPMLKLIDPKDAQCGAKGCLYSVEQVPLYKDSHHLNYYGSKSLGEVFLETQGNFLRN